MGLTYADNGGIYRIRDLSVAPHPLERILADLYYRFEAQGRMEALFYEGDKPTLRWWLNNFMAPETSTLACYRETTDGEYEVDGRKFTPIGMTWINKTWPIGKKFRKAEVGMGFVKGVPIEDTVDCGRLTIEWAFRNLSLDALIGTTPQPNRAAVMFGQRLGFNQSGPVYGFTAWHGRLCGAMIQSLTRDQWEAIKAAGFEVAA